MNIEDALWLKHSYEQKLSNVSDESYARACELLSKVTNIIYKCRICEVIYYTIKDTMEDKEQLCWRCYLNTK